MKKHTVTATPVCDLTSALGARHFHALSIGAKRDVLLLSVEEPVYGNGSMLIRKLKFHSFRLHRWHHQTLEQVDLPPTQQVFHYAQLIESNHYLCVAGRCAKEEPNAHVFDGDGVLKRSWSVGDGVEDVQVSPDNQVWVSYFDEGVFGDSALSQQGLNRFDAQGQATFCFYTDAVGMGAIADCYALNVASNRDTYLLIYTGFPLVHLRDAKVHAVHQPSSEMIGSHAFAIMGDSLLFAGGYHFKKRLFWRSISRNIQIELEVLDENGGNLQWDSVQCRGADLFLCRVSQVWMLSLLGIGF